MSKDQVAKDTLEQRVEKGFLTRAYNKVADALTYSKITLASLLAAAAIALPGQAQAQSPTWNVELSRVDTVGSNKTYVYKITNTSTNHSNFRMTSQRSGAGTNLINKINYAYGGRDMDYDWSVTYGTDNTFFGSATGVPIDPAGDYGYFEIRTTEQETGLIPFNATSILAGAFPTVYVTGPVKNYNLNVSSSAGTPNPSGTTRQYHDKNVTASIDSVVQNGTTQFVNKGWVGTGSVPSTGSSNQVSFAITNDSNLNWQWNTNYFLDTESQTGGSVNVNDQWINSGSNLVITASPTIGYDFAGWTGDINTNANPLNVTMDSAKKVTANFNPKNYNLNVNSAHGTPTPGTGNFTYGSNVTASVDQIVNDGATQYVNNGWTGSGSVPSTGNTNNVTFNMTNDSNIAWLWLTNYWLNAEAPTGGSVNVADGFYAKDSSKQITATPQEGYYFKQWTGDVSSKQNPLEVLIDSPKNITADFRKKPEISNNVKAGNGITFYFQDLDTNQEYSVQKSTNLVDPSSWNAITNFTAYTGSTNVTVNTDGDKGFYRLSFTP